MDKLVYYSPECFLDVDLPVLDSLAKKNNILWVLILDSLNFYSKKEIENFCFQRGIKIMSVERKYRRSSLFQLFISYNIIKKIKAFNASVYYFEQFDNPFITLFVFLTLPRKRIVIGVHDVVPHSNHAKLLTKYHKNFYLNAFDNYHLFSQTQKEFFEKNYRNANTYVIPLNLKDFGKANAVKKNGKLKLLFFGKIHTYKGLDILIEAVNKLPKDIDLSITIAGSCKNFEVYTKLIKRNVYDYQIGFINNQQIPDLFVTHDYLLLPYRDVTQSGPLYIALNYNLPVIASDLPGFNSHITDGVNGFLFKDSDPVALKEKIIEVYNRKDLDTIKSNLKEYTKKHFEKNHIRDKYMLMFKEIKNE